MEKEDIILFGAGRLGKNVLKYLRDNYTIKYWVDNNKDKWGCEYDRLTISSPDNVKGFEGKIVVAIGVEYMEEVVEQLLKEGISEERIFWGRNNEREYLVPYNADFLNTDDRCLKEFDLYKDMEDVGDGEKVLLLCSSYTPYVIQLVRNVKKRYPDIGFSLLTRSKEYKDELSEYLSHLYIFELYADLKNIFDKLPVYKTLHMLWIEDEWVYLRRSIKREADKCVLNIGGSDFYRAGKTLLENYRSNLIYISDIINVQSVNVKQDFVRFFPDVEEKIQITNYGIEVIDYIPVPEKRRINSIKRRLSLDEDRIIVTCGHNCSKAHQHIDIIKAISELRSELKDRIECVFPMTYPGDMEQYIETVNTYLKASELKYRILTEYLDFEEMAEYASISDIMIHVQTTDQLSSAMLEQMYAGSIVIAGSWLPYEWLRKEGIYFVSVDDFEELTRAISDVVNSIDLYKEKCRHNRALIYKLCSWDNIAEKWVKMWGIRL